MFSLRRLKLGFLNSYIAFFIGLGKRPEGLYGVLPEERKPLETTEAIRHRIYSRIFGIMWVSEFIFIVVISKHFLCSLLSSII